MVEHHLAKVNVVSSSLITRFLSRIILAAAYFISVTYYLQLLAAFLLKSFGISENHYQII